MHRAMTSILGAVERKWKMFLAENIKYLREQAEMTQTDLANELGDIGQKAVSKWEKGEREPELSRIIRMAELFKVSLDELVLRELKPPTPLYVLNVKFLREKNKMSQEDMANLLGFKSQCSVSLAEKGERQLSVENLEKISDFFGVTMDQLVKKDLSKGAE